MQEQPRGAPSTRDSRTLIASLVLALLGFAVPATAAANGYPPPPGPYPFDLPALKPAAEALQPAANSREKTTSAKPVSPAAPRSQATNLFGAPPATPAPASQPVRPAPPSQPYRAQPYPAPGYRTPPAFAYPRPAPPARPQAPTSVVQPTGDTAPATEAPARNTDPQSPGTVLQTPAPMAGGSRFRPPEAGETR